MGTFLRSIHIPRDSNFDIIFPEERFSQKNEVTGVRFGPQPDDAHPRWSKIRAPAIPKRKILFLFCK